MMSDFRYNATTNKAIITVVRHFVVNMNWAIIALACGLLLSGIL